MSRTTSGYRIPGFRCRGRCTARGGLIRPGSTWTIRRRPRSCWPQWNPSARHAGTRRKALRSSIPPTTGTPSGPCGRPPARRSTPRSTAPWKPSPAGTPRRRRPARRLSSTPLTHSRRTARNSPGSWSGKAARPSRTPWTKSAKRSTSAATTRRNATRISKPGPRCRDRPARPTRSACTGAACSPPSPRGTFPSRSSPGRPSPPSPRATASPRNRRRRHRSWPGAPSS